MDYKSMPALLLLLLCVCDFVILHAQQIKTSSTDAVLITVILKHQQDKNLKQIQEIQKTNKYWDIFPPKERGVVSWYAVMRLARSLP